MVFRLSKVRQQPRLTTFVDVTATSTGLRAYLVDEAGLRLADLLVDETNPSPVVGGH
jgi:hypothetical protein